MKTITAEPGRRPPGLLLPRTLRRSHQTSTNPPDLTSVGTERFTAERQQQRGSAQLGFIYLHYQLHPERFPRPDPSTATLLLKSRVITAFALKGRAPSATAASDTDSAAQLLFSAEERINHSQWKKKQPRNAAFGISSMQSQWSQLA